MVVSPDGRISFKTKELSEKIAYLPHQLITAILAAEEFYNSENSFRPALNIKYQRKDGGFTRFNMWIETAIAVLRLCTTIESTIESTQIKEGKLEEAMKLYIERRENCEPGEKIAHENDGIKSLYLLYRRAERSDMADDRIKRLSEEVKEKVKKLEELQRELDARETLNDDEKVFLLLKIFLREAKRPAISQADFNKLSPLDKAKLLKEIQRGARVLLHIDRANPKEKPVAAGVALVFNDLLQAFAKRHDIPLK